MINAIGLDLTVKYKLEKKEEEKKKKKKKEMWRFLLKNVLH